MTERVHLSIADHIAVMELARPEKMNALDPAMFDAIIATTATIAGNADVRVVVLTGSGESFCSGLDIASFAADGQASLLERMQPLPGTDANYYQQPALGLRRLPVPVIAALHGVVFGGGLQIAFGADLRIAAPDTRFSVMEVKWGVVPDMGITVTARDIIPADRMKRLALTGDVIDANEALTANLVTEVAESPRDRAMALATTIVNRSPDAVQATKLLCNRAVDGDTHAALRNEAETQLRVIGKPNQMEAVAANFAKRVPQFGPVSG
ncbi:MAG: crotonase/enoyl-CoA hydratase family protein [Pseudomonadota bacterium]